MSTTSELSPSRPNTAPPPLGDSPAPPRPAVAPLLLRLHFYAGILVAPFLVVAALSGLAFVFTPQLDRLAYADQLQVATVERSRHPLADQVAAARAAHPTGTLAAVIPPATATETTRVVFSLPALGEKQHTVYVDPYTNRVQGTLSTWFGETPLQTWFDDLHRNLHAGAVGRMYSELAASWLWVIVLAGLVLWLRRQRGTRYRLRRLLLPERAARQVRRTRSWHAVTGVWLLIGLLGLSATGLTWSRYAGGHFSSALNALNSHTPELPTAVPAATPSHHAGAPTAPAGADPTALDRVVATARAAGLSGPIEVTAPDQPDNGWTVAQTDRQWPVHFDRVVVSADGATVTARSNFGDWPLLAQLSKLGVQAHMGYLLGLTNQLLLAALALGLLAGIFWAYRMWWQRRPTRADRRAPVGDPPARGAWLRLPASVIVVGVPTVVAVGWALPEFGVSLLAFLAVDLAVGALRRRRTGRAVPTSPAPAGS